MSDKWTRQDKIKDIYDGERHISTIDVKTGKVLWHDETYSPPKHLPKRRKVQAKVRALFDSEPDGYFSAHAYLAEQNGRRGFQTCTSRIYQGHDDLPRYGRCKRLQCWRCGKAQLWREEGRIALEADYLFYIGGVYHVVFRYRDVSIDTTSDKAKIELKALIKKAMIAYRVKVNNGGDVFRYRGVPGFTEIRGQLHYHFICNRIINGYPKPGENPENIWLSDGLKGIAKAFGLTVYITSPNTPQGAANIAGYLASNFEGARDVILPPKWQRILKSKGMMKFTKPSDESASVRAFCNKHRKGFYATFTGLEIQIKRELVQSAVNFGAEVWTKQNGERVYFDDLRDVNQWLHAVNMNHVDMSEILRIVGRVVSPDTESTLLTCIGGHVNSLISHYCEKWQADTEISAMPAELKFIPSPVKKAVKDYLHNRRPIRIFEESARFARNKAKRHDVASTVTTMTLIMQYRRQRGMCYHCGDFVSFHITCDHLTPFAKRYGIGGANTPGNTVISCPSCNARKGALTAAQYATKKARKGDVHPDLPDGVPVAQKLNLKWTV